MALYGPMLYLDMELQKAIQYASKTDIPELVLLINGAYRGDSSRKGWTTEADLLDGTRIGEDSLGEIMEKPDSLIIKYANEENKIIGCAHLQKEGATLYLGMLSVMPDLQAAGIGKSLLNASAQYGRSVNCKEILISVISLRSELIAWYERRGFQITGETKPFPAQPEFGITRQQLFFIVMQKKLT
jgi:N-acetylglutamate synthase-like GNAT family acetyltransferase